MRGSPLFRFFIALFVLLGLGVPLRYLLQANETPAPLAAASAASQVPMVTVHLQITFTTPPAKLSVLALGKEVWSENAPAAEVEHDLTLAWPKEGVDLQFNLAWPDGKPCSARVRLTDPQGGEQVKYLWGDGATTDVLTFS